MSQNSVLSCPVPNNKNEYKTVGTGQNRVYFEAIILKQQIIKINTNTEGTGQDRVLTHTGCCIKDD
jgi:hypothetical protein